MEILSKNEIWREEAGHIAFDHTKILLKNGTQYFYAVDPHRYMHGSKPKLSDISKLDITPIPESNVYPNYLTDRSQAPKPLPKNTFVKGPALINFDTGNKDKYELAFMMLREATAYENLKASPHPNILPYHGCIVKDGQITGLVLENPDADLPARVRGHLPLNNSDIDAIMDGITAGLKHLHSMGLIHCDINPSNIFMKGDVPLIGNFEKCRREGEVDRFGAPVSTLKHTNGTEGWEVKEFMEAGNINDWYGLWNIKVFLVEERDTPKVRRSERLRKKGKERGSQE